MAYIHHINAKYFIVTQGNSTILNQTACSLENVFLASSNSTGVMSTSSCVLTQMTRFQSRMTTTMPFFGIFPFLVNAYLTEFVFNSHFLALY